MDMPVTIPIIDLNEVNIDFKDTEIKSETLKSVAEKLVRAFIDIGFVYVTNHGISKEIIKKCWQTGEQFFELPLSTKMEAEKDWKASICGYLPASGSETSKCVINEFFGKSKSDFKESMQLCHSCDFKQLPKFNVAAHELIQSSQALALRLMLLLGYGLTPDCPTTFLEGFKEFCTPSNSSSVLRFIHYPKAPNNEIPTAGQYRCGEHTDYSAITLLYSSETPGLQVYTRQATYIDVDGIEGGILVNVGDLLQRWSGDQLLSARHRVIYRPDTFLKDRYSLIYFATPDNDYVVSPVTGKLDRYPPVRSQDYQFTRDQGTFEHYEGIAEDLLQPQ